MTAAGRMRPAAVAVIALAHTLALGLLGAGPARAHSEGLTPYRYVLAPPGVRSVGPPEMGASTQPLGRAGFAGTTDNQMQLTLPPGVLPKRSGEKGVRVTLDQLDPADLPDLPAGLEPEGNGYRVRMIYASSNKRLARLAKPATLGLSAPAPPTALFELVDGAWRSARYTAVKAESGFTSVLELVRPGTFLQAYDPATAQTTAGDELAPAAPAARSPSSSSSTAPGMAFFGGGAVLLLATVLLALRLRWTRSHSDSTSEHACS